MKFRGSSILSEQKLQWYFRLAMVLWLALVSVSLAMNSPAASSGELDPLWIKGILDRIFSLIRLNAKFVAERQDRLDPEISLFQMHCWPKVS